MILNKIKEWQARCFVSCKRKLKQNISPKMQHFFFFLAFVAQMTQHIKMQTTDCCCPCLFWYTNVTVGISVVYHQNSSFSLSAIQCGVWCLGSVESYACNRIKKCTQAGRNSIYVVCRPCLLHWNIKLMWSILSMRIKRKANCTVQI